VEIEEDGVAVQARVDRAELENARAENPSLANRRV
jgi:hypothetical protein